MGGLPPPPLFQSHLGSISTNGYPYAHPHVFRFQSHLGSISTGTDRAPRDALDPCFNPTLVRLARGEAVIEADPHRRFNPTLVRLAHVKRRTRFRRDPGFNPTLVRLAPE